MMLLFAANYLFTMPPWGVKFVLCGVYTLMFNLDMTIRRSHVVPCLNVVTEQNSEFYQ
jgi:hypothetical protein